MFENIDRTIKITNIDYNKPIDEKFLTKENLKYFIMGYRAAINSKLDNRLYYTVNTIEHLEEYLYLEGARIGESDYNIGFCDRSNEKFDDDYLETIKISLTISNFGEALSIIMNSICSRKH